MTHLQWSQRITNGACRSWNIRWWKWSYELGTIVFWNLRISSSISLMSAIQLLKSLYTIYIYLRRSTDNILVSPTTSLITTLEIIMNLDASARRTKFGEMTFGHIFTKFFNLKCKRFINLQPLKFSLKLSRMISTLFCLIENSVVK